MDRIGATSVPLPAPTAWAQRALSRAAGDRRLDAVVERIWGSLSLAQRPAARRLLRGEWLGHAFHPLATDFTAGPWMAASFLDLFGPPDSAPAARRLVALGLAAAIPTWLSGMADWRETQHGDRRVGLLHAATSTLATSLYAASYVARRRGRPRAGVALGVIGGLVAIGDGYVGGELSLVARAGTGRRVRAPAARGR